MKRFTILRHAMTASAVALVTAMVACSGAGDGETEVDDIDRTASPVWGGYTVSGCSKAEVQKIHDAIGVLLKAGSSGYSTYYNCMKKAVFVENDCRTYMTIAPYIKSDDVTKITCKQLGGAAGEVDEDDVDIKGQRMSLDHEFLAGFDKVQVAGTIIHELMHNHGFLHDNNPHKSKYYGNTVPEQAEACVERGVPNAWPGTGSGPTQGCPDPGRKCPNNKPYCCDPLPNNECISCAVDNRTCP